MTGPGKRFRAGGRILTVVIAASCLGQAARAQDWDSKISCHTNGVDKPRNRSHRKKLWGGYEISLGPARNGGGVEDACTAAIYNGAGRVVFRTSGFSVIFDGKLTGQDFDDDGRPEVVFITDAGGGMHCCWAYNVVSLFPRPHKLFDIAAAGAVEFERDEQGKMII